MSLSTSSMCVLCTHQPSITSCEGCQRKFCLTCLSQHRDELSLELDDLINYRNELVQIINNNSPDNTTDKCPCFDEINRWQNKMHTTIDRIASIARDNVRQILSESNKNVRIEFDQISKDLQQRQKTGGYVEGDLQRIKQQLTKLNDIVKRFSEQIRIDTSLSERIDWNSLLFVVSNKERQSYTTATAVSSSPNLHNSFNRRTNGGMSMPHQQFYPNTPPPAYTPHPTNTQRPVGRNPSHSIGSRPLTYTCIGCKTTNNFNENGRNVCSVCRCPAPF